MGPGDCFRPNELSPRASWCRHVFEGSQGYCAVMKLWLRHDEGLDGFYAFDGDESEPLDRNSAAATALAHERD